MKHHFGTEAGAALVFGVLYFIMWMYMAFMYATKRYQWKSRWTILFLHCLIRVASQACGVAFGVLVWDNINVFVAYLILGAEGYFSLTIAAYYFLKHYEISHFGSSRLGPAIPPKHNAGRRVLAAFSFAPLFMPWKYWHHELIAVVDSWLIPANALIISGGSIMSSSRNEKLTPEDIDHKLFLAKCLRTAGGACFLALTCLFIVLLALLARRIKAAHPPPRNANAALTFFGISAIMLFVRGMFGVLQAAIYSLSYFNFANYTGTGFTHRFVALEYCLAVVPEFVAAAIFNASYWATRHLQTSSPTHGTSIDSDDQAHELDHSPSKEHPEETFPGSTKPVSYGA